MQRNMRLRVSIYLTTLIAILVIASIFAGCNRNPVNQNANTPRTTTGPSPSPSPAGSPGPQLLPGDTIIVVKDGSVEIEIQESLCALQNDSDNIFFKCNGVHLTDVMIRNDKGNAPIRCPKLGPFPKVTIDGGGAKPIEVQDHLTETTIKFRKADYPACGISPLKYCGTNNLGKIIVGTYSQDCKPAEKCEVWMYK